VRAVRVRGMEAARTTKSIPFSLSFFFFVSFESEVKRNERDCSNFFKNKNKSVTNNKEF